jgi:hypothetical protein
VGLRRLHRARLQTRLYLADRDLFERESPLRRPDPAAPPERAARALKRSSAEPLALDQRRERRDTTLNLLGQQQEQLDRHRERTSKQLRTARHELEHLHWWNRDRRAELQTEITLHRQALHRADQKHEQLRELTEQRSRRIALDRERDARTRSRQPELAARRPTIKLEREPRSRGLER